jgi:hypothetical protein
MIRAVLALQGVPLWLCTLAILFLHRLGDHPGG